MLKLTNIVKDYDVADMKVHALKKVNLVFRKNEFVSVLGPSGCGKTTLLNIIGGLDKYTSGDLMINGVSTKEFADRDWDVYRNHRVGFVFQSYNLIPHQTVLGNVELSLTIAGLNKQERTDRAKAALDRVGLSDQYNKRPNQLSGGQSQRVAIARALVNDPEILLADEPTGALDSQTSVQIMDLIKEIAKERLVIMVTHNAELAKEYSTRIVNLLDGEVVGDSNPFSVADEAVEVKKTIEKEESNYAHLTPKEKKRQKKREKAKMSFFTALRLSFKNLMSKKGRTIMTGFAGSIGIIGVSLVLAISSGVTGFITSMQEDMLSGNPITVSESAYDLSALMSNASMFDKDDVDIKDGVINVDSTVENLIKSAGNTIDNLSIQNDITKDYIDFVKQMPKEYYAAMAFKYGLDMTINVYTDFYVTRSDKEAGTNAQNMSLTALTNMYTAILKETEFKRYASYITGLSTVLSQAIDNEEYVLSQYDILGDGHFAKEKDEVMLVLNNDKQTTDLLLTQLGYYTQDEFLNIAYKAANDINYKPELDKKEFSYEEIYGKTFTWYPNDTLFTENGPSLSPSLTNPFSYKAYSDDTFTEGIELKVAGILQPKEGVSYGSLSSGFYYTSALAEYAIETNMNSKVATKMREDKVETYTFSYDPTKMEPVMGYIPGMGDYIDYTFNYVYDNVVKEDVVGFVGSSNSLMSLLGSFMPSQDEDDTSYEVVSVSLRQFGGKDIPNRVQIYPGDFELKDEVTNYLNKWNSSETLLVNGNEITAEDRKQIKYTDNLSLVISLINDMVNIVTYALVAFTSLSLVVSTVMIGIITYVSVVERVKEIGVIRSLGGRKKDVSSLFNAETFIIGFVAGLIGIIVTYLLSLIINLIVGSLSGIYTLAALPIWQAAIMVGISVVLTLISGLIPAKAAANKDPVVALRTE